MGFLVILSEYTGFRNLAATTSIKLTDKYLDLSKKISDSQSSYCFSMDEKITKSWGNSFILTLEPSSGKTIDERSGENETILYPNPFVNKFYLKNGSEKSFHTKLTISNPYGQTLLTKQLLISPGVQEINVAHLPKGIYLIDLFDRIKNKSLKTFKVIKR